MFFSIVPVKQCVKQGGMLTAECEFCSVCGLLFYLSVLKSASHAVVPTLMRVQYSKSCMTNVV